MAIKIGTRIGRYEIKRELGEGGMGKVFLAYDRHLETDRALKFISIIGMAREEFTERFLREAQAAAQLGSHRNVVTVHDHVNEHGATPAHIVMEYVVGTPLNKVLETNRQLSIDRSLSLMKGICAGVAAAHRNRCVHRDLDPKNVIVCDDGPGGEVPKICDWGLVKIPDARANESKTAITEADRVGMGKFPYMAPEAPATAGPQADVYSLGILLYEMIAGERPFKGPSPEDYLRQHREADPPPFKEELNIPAQLQTVVIRALAKSPNERQKDAAELSAELTEVQQQLARAIAEEDAERRRQELELLRIDLAKEKDISNRAQLELAQATADNQALQKKLQLTISAANRSNGGSGTLNKRERRLILGSVLVCVVLLIMLVAALAAWSGEQDERLKSEQQAANHFQSLQATQREREEANKRVTAVENAEKERTQKESQLGTGLHDGDVYVSYVDNVLRYRFAKAGRYEVAVTGPNDENECSCPSPSRTWDVFPSPADQYFTVTESVQKSVPKDFTVWVRETGKSKKDWAGLKFTKPGT